MQSPSTYIIPDSRDNICLSVRRVGEDCILIRFSPLHEGMPFNATKGLSQRDCIALANALSAVALGGFDYAVSAEFLRRKAEVDKRFSREAGAYQTHKPTLEQL